LQNELDSVRKINTGNKKTIIELESQIQQEKSDSISMKLNLQQLEQQVLLQSKNNEWINSQLEGKISEFNTFRNEKLGLISSLQNDLAALQISFHSLESSNDRLKDRFAETTQKLNDALNKIKQLQDEKATNEEAFLNDMDALRKLAEVWEKAATDLKTRVQELEEALDNERTRAIEEVGYYEEEAEREKAKAEKLEKKLANLETQLGESLNNGALPASLLNNGFKNGPVTTSTDIVCEIQKNGGSLVQLYSDFSEVKTRLEREKIKNTALREQLSSILEDMESQAPVILAEREENFRLESELAQLSVDLETATKKNEELADKLKTSEIKAADAERESKLLNTQIKDLSRQVQNLLIQQQLTNDTTAPLTSAEHIALQRLVKGEDPTESDTDKLISKRLVLFNNTIQLQKQNENLLKITRQLGSEMEKKEAESKKLLDNVESTAVSEATEVIKTLQEDVENLQAKLSTVQRERDMFRRMLSNRSENGVSLDTLVDSSSEGVANLHAQQLIKQIEALNGTLKAAHNRYDELRTQSDANAKVLEEKISAISSERSALQIQVAKANSQLELSTEQFKNLESNFKNLQNEYTDLKKRADSLQDLLSSQDARNRQMSEEASLSKSQVESLQNELANYRAEKRVSESIKNNLKTRIQELEENGKKINALITHYQTTAAEQSSIAAETQQQLNSQIAALQEETNTIKKKLETSERELKGLTHLKDIQSREYQDRINKLSTDLHEARESLLQAKDEKHHFELRLRETSLELKNATENLNTLKQRQIDQQSTASTETSTSIADNEVSTLRNSLTLLNVELENSKKHIEHLKTVSQDAENTTQSLLQEFETYKVDIAESLAVKDSSIASLQAQLETATTSLKLTENEFNKFKEEEAKKLDAHVAEEIKLKGLVETLQVNEKRLQEFVNQMKTDVSRQTQLATEAKQNYENEVAKHTETAGALSVLRDEYTQLKQKVLDLSLAAERATEQLHSSETSWEFRKFTYEQEIEQLKSRDESLSNQNKILLDQLERVSTQLVGRSELLPNYTDTPEFEASSEEQLRDIISHIRREKDILDVKYDSVSKELKNTTLKLKHAELSLENVRAELEREKSLADEKIKLKADHEKVLAQLNDINILRESNSTLRQQSQFYSQKVTDLEAELTKLRASAMPLENQVRTLSAELETKTQQLALSQQDGARWRTRAQQILQKYDRIDPEELKQLQEQLETLKTQNADLLSNNVQSEEQKKKTTSELEIKLKESEEKSVKLKADLDALEARFAKIKSEFLEKMGKRRHENAALKEQLATANNTINELNTKFESLKASNAASTTGSNEATAKLNAELEAVKKELETSNAENASLQESIKSLQQQQQQQQQPTVSSDADKAKFDALAAEYETFKKNAEQLQKELEVSRAEIDQYKSTLEAAQTQIESFKQSGADDVDKAVRISELETEIKNVQAQLAETIAASEVTDVTPVDITEINELKKQVEELNTGKKQLADQLARIKAAHEAKLREVQSGHDANILQLQQRMRDMIAQRTESIRNQTEEEFKKKLEEAIKKNAETAGASNSPDVAASSPPNNGFSPEDTAQIEALRKLREKLDEQHKAEIERLKKEFEEEKRQAVEAAFTTSRKETEMRTKLLQMKADKAEKAKEELKAQLQALTGDSTPSHAAKGPAALQPPQKQPPPQQQQQQLQQQPQQNVGNNRGGNNRGRGGFNNRGNRNFQQHQQGSPQQQPNVQQPQAQQQQSPAQQSAQQQQLSAIQQQRIARFGTPTNPVTTSGLSFGNTVQQQPPMKRQNDGDATAAAKRRKEESTDAAQ
jgi:nucleoprotein TPR